MQMNSIRLSSSAQSGSSAAEAAVSACSCAPSALQRCAMAALDRCTGFTADLELSHLLPVLDSSLQQALDRIAAVVDSVGHSLAPSSSAETKSGAQSQRAPFDLQPLPEATLQHLLRLPLVLASLQASVTAIDTEVRTRANSLLRAAGAVSGDGATSAEAGLHQRTLDVVAWRLNSSSAAMDRTVAWQQQLNGVLLPKAFAAMAALERTVNSLLTAALCATSFKALAEVRLLACLDQFVCACLRCSSCA